MPRRPLAEAVSLGWVSKFAFSKHLARECVEDHWEVDWVIMMKGLHPLFDDMNEFVY
jgi:hypothetical protein